MSKPDSKVRKTIWVNSLIFNEDKYIWFAVKSVIDYVDKILIWDSGSTDRTEEVVKILQKKYPQKIIFKKIGRQDAGGVTYARQEMLKETKSDWLIILDGDEVWWKDSIKKVIFSINTRNDLYAVVIPVINLIGDIFHFQEEKAGRYQILGRKGHMNLRAINLSTPGLKIKNDYPLEGFYDGEDKLLQEESEKLLFVDAPLLHFSSLKRSSKNETGASKKRKMRYEIGNRFPENFKYPEVLFERYPSIVPSPWQHMQITYRLRSLIETPIKKIKRRLT